MTYLYVSAVAGAELLFTNVGGGQEQLVSDITGLTAFRVIWTAVIEE
jgi:hypothetical protein